MLRMLRDGAKSPVTKFFLFGLMAMAVAGLVFMDVQGVFRGGVAPTNVAEIGDSKITIQDFNNVVRRSMQQQRMSETEAYKLGVIDQLLAQEIQMRLLRREAVRQGLYVDEKAVANELDNMLVNISQSMDVDKGKALQLLLQSQGVSEPQLVGMMKSQISSGLLLDGVLAGPHPPKQLTDDFARFRYEKRSGRYAVIDQKTAGKPDQPDEEALQTLYKQLAPHRFALPEYRRLDIAILSPDSVKGMVEITEEELRAEYERRLDEYKIPEQWSVAQTLVSDAATAQEIADKARAGATLKQATKDVMGDTIAYIPAELFIKSEISDALRDTVVKMSVNEISDPVESPLGWHVVKLDKKIDAYERSFEEVREDLHDEMMMDLAGDSLYDLTIQFDDMIAGGMTAKEAAGELGVKIVSVEPVDISGNLQNGEAAQVKAEEFPALLKEAFQLSEGETTQLLQSGQSDYIGATVTEIVPTSLRPFEEVEKEVRKAWIDKETRVRASKMAGELIEKIKSGESFDDVASSAGLKVVRVDNLGRNPGEDSKHPAGLEAALFNIDTLGSVENLISGTNAVIVQLDDIVHEIPEDNVQELDAIASITSRLLKQDRMSLYRMALYNKYDVKTNEAALEQMYGAEQ